MFVFASNKSKNSKELVFFNDLPLIRFPLLDRPCLLFDSKYKKQAFSDKNRYKNIPAYVEITIIKKYSLNVQNYTIKLCLIIVIV